MITFSLLKETVSRDYVPVFPVVSIPAARASIAMITGTFESRPHFRIICSVKLLFNSRETVPLTRFQLSHMRGLGPTMGQELFMCRYVVVGFNY